MPLATELTPLIPHPIELALAAHVLLTLAALVVATVLVATQRIPALPTFVAALVLTLFVPLLGPVIALVLVLVQATRRQPREA